MSKARFASGCNLVKPPTVPSAKGISIENLNILFFPSGGREPYNDDNISTYNLLQRTEVLNYLYANEFEESIIITYNDAIIEKLNFASTKILILISIPE